MALEDLTGAAKFLGSLIVTNPVASDDRREGDDHIRGIKNVLKNTFPALDAAWAVAIVSGRVSTVLPVAVPDGTAAAPALTFATDPDCGWYRVQANVVGGVVAGAEVFRMSSTRVTGMVGFHAIDGAASGPGYAFTNSLTTGLYSPAVGEWALANAGITRFRVNQNGHLLTLLPSSVPTVGNMVTSEMAFSRVSDTSLRVSMRGSDGTLRSATLTLA